MRKLKKSLLVAGLIILSGLLSGCEPPEVYGSVGYSSWSGGGWGYGGPSSGIGGSVTMSGRIF